jgi:FkbM family methyltransferase
VNLLRKSLHRILGLEKYLSLTSRIFFMTFRSGLLRGVRSYDCHHFVKNLVKKGDVIIDIGANLGYYTRIFSGLTGPGGKVYAVEPVAVFINVLRKNTGRQQNIEILPFALGKDGGTRVRLGIPRHSKYLSHGRTHVIGDQEDNDYLYVTEAKMENPGILFKDLQQLNYIKCDVEGFENEVIPEFLAIISRFRPIIQVETEKENRKLIFGMMMQLHYNCFWLEKNRLKRLEKPDSFSYGDLFFIPSSRMGNFIVT